MMDSLDSLREYFKIGKPIENRSPIETIEVATWTEREGLAWVPPNRLPQIVEDLWLNPISRPTLLTHVGNDERELGHGFVIYLLFHYPWDFTLTLGIRGIEERFPSLTTLCPALNWPEREVQDLLGLVAEGHPDPRALVLHPGWQEGFHPLRKDDENKNAFEPQPFVFSAAQGEGTFEVPVGPIHAGIIEPGHFRFQTIGETVLHLDAQIFYTHKGIEKLLEGKSIEEGLKIIERICGVCTVSHSLAYCEAVEKLKQIQPSRETLRWRTVLAELERLYNHVGDIGNMCAGVGFALGNANGLQNKERLQRLNKEIFGHRFLRGLVVPGGVAIQPESEKVRVLKTHLLELEADFEKWIPLILEHDGFRQRAVTTGVLKNQSALDLGVTGPAARASGVNTDWRECHAHLLYPELQVKAQVETTGDVWARLMVRVREVRQSFKILVTLLQETKDLNNPHLPHPIQNLQDRPASEGSKELGVRIKPYSFSWGCVESPRGTDVIWLMLDGAGKIYRCRIRSAAYANWPAVPLAVLGNIVPDFPLINKSFELCYSCCDR
jgi:Ni,Fe-hydrogenase III large subunit/Ni,Fe-hydrogenase III component G